MRSIVRALPLLLLLALLDAAPAFAQAPISVKDPGANELVFVEDTPDKAVSYLCKIIQAATTVTSAQCGTPTAAINGLAAFTWGLPATLVDGDYTVQVAACGPGSAGCFWSTPLAFTVNHNPGPPPPPPPPPPDTPNAPVIITIRPRAGATPAATFGARAAAVPTPATPSVLVSVPFTELARTRICLHDRDNTPICHNGDWWVALFARTRD